MPHHDPRSHPCQTAPATLQLQLAGECVTPVGDTPQAGVALGAIFDTADQILAAAEAATVRDNPHETAQVVQLAGNAGTCETVAAAVHTHLGLQWGLAVLDAATCNSATTAVNVWEAFNNNPPDTATLPLDDARQLNFGEVDCWVLLVVNGHLLAGTSPHTLPPLPAQRIRRMLLLEHVPQPTRPDAIPAPDPTTTTSRRSARRLPDSYNNILGATVASALLLAMAALLAATALLFGGFTDVWALPAAFAATGAAGMGVAVPATRWWAGRRPASAASSHAIAVTGEPATRQQAPPALRDTYRTCTAKLDWYANLIVNPVDTLLEAPALLDPTYRLLDNMFETVAAFQNAYGTLYPTWASAAADPNRYQTLAQTVIDQIDTAHAEAKRIGFTPPPPHTATDAASATAVAELSDLHRKLAQTRSDVAAANATAARLTGLSYTGSTSGEQATAAGHAANANRRLTRLQQEESAARDALLAAGRRHLNTSTAPTLYRAVRPAGQLDAAAHQGTPR